MHGIIMFFYKGAAHLNRGVPQGFEADADVIVDLHVMQNVSEKARCSEIVGAIRYALYAMLSHQRLQNQR